MTMGITTDEELRLYNNSAAFRQVTDGMAAGLDAGLLTTRQLELACRLAITTHRRRVMAAPTLSSPSTQLSTSPDNPDPR